MTKKDPKKGLNKVILRKAARNPTGFQVQSVILTVRKMKNEILPADV